MTFKEKLSEILQNVYLRVEKEPSIVKHAQDKILALVESDIVGDDEIAATPTSFNGETHKRNLFRREQREKLK